MDSSAINMSSHWTHSFILASYVLLYSFDMVIYFRYVAIPNAIFITNGTMGTPKLHVCHDLKLAMFYYQWFLSDGF